MSNRQDSPREPNQSGNSPRPELSDASDAVPPVSRQVLTPVGSSALALRRDPSSHSPEKERTDSNSSAKTGEPIERREGRSADESGSDNDDKEDPDKSSGDSSSDEESDENDSDDDSDDSDNSDDSDDDDSDEEEDSDDSDEDNEDAKVSAATHKRLGRIRPQTTKPTLISLNKPAAAKPGGLALGGMKLPIPKPAMTGVHLALPLNQLATPSSQNNGGSSGSPPVTPVPVDYDGVRDLHIDLERLVADRFEREQFQEKFEKKNPEILKFLSRHDTLKALVRFATRSFEPKRPDDADLSAAQRTIIIDSCANFSVYLLTSTACSRLQALLVRNYELLDELFAVLKKSDRKNIPTGEWSKLISSLATQKSGEELKKYFTDSARKDMSLNIVSLLVDNVDSAHVAKMLTEILAPEKPRIVWTDFFAEAPFDFPSALLKRYATISELKADEFPYILYVELKHISDLVASVLDRVATSPLGKSFTSSSAYVATLVSAVHRSRLALASAASSSTLLSPIPAIHPSLSPAILMLAQIIRHQVNGGRYNELCTPALEALCPGEDATFFTDITELLKDTQGGDGKRMRFGLFRNQLVDMIEGLYNCGYQKIHEKMFSAKVFEALFDVFLSRASNTILHQKAANIIRDVLQCNSKEQLVEFVKDYKFVDKLVDAFDKYEATMPNVKDFNALDYYPHLFQIVQRLDLVAKMGSRYQQLSDYLLAHEGWKRFLASNLYKNYDELLKRKLMKEQGAVYIRKKPNVRR